IYSVLVMLNVLFETYCAARQSFRASSLLAVQRDVVATIATLIGAFWYRRLDAIFLALIIGRAVSFLVSVAYVGLRLDGFRSRRYFFNMREQVRYGMVLGIGGTVGTFAMRLHEMAVSRSYEVGDYAIYAAGLKQIPVLQFFGQSVAAVALGQFAVLVKNEDWEGVRRLWDRILGTMYGVGLPVALFLIAVADPLVRLMFTNEYANAISIFRINTIASLALVLNSTLVLRAMDRNDVTLKVNLVHIALLPPGLMLGIRMFGMNGAVAVHTLLMLGSKVAAQAYLNRLVPVHLAYVASRRATGAFYVDSWRKGRQLLARVAAR
ncbi:MAG TPA: oligosaccharide flippase family protein, partial [Candidatus Krumholzibacteria bacterium]|nr:oligosaccharide flippase family protein [Candidatus Krumholzibacteria bacterium]